MAENKRDKRTETISKNRVDQTIEPVERPISYIDFFNSARSDGTSSFRPFIASTIDYAGIDGDAKKLHFYVTKNDNPNLTATNKVVEMTIPIFPVVCNINSRESVNSFIKNATSRKKICEAYENMNPEVREQRIAQYTDKVMSYITTELALRYLLAKVNNDKIIMKQISNMAIMREQGFDFKLFEAIANNPKTLRRKKDGAYLVFENKGSEDLVLISDEQADKYAGYKDAIDKFPAIETQFTTLNNDLEVYKNYDINQAKNANTVGGHSLKNKMRGSSVVVDKTTPAANTPAQPGE